MLVEMCLFLLTAGIMYTMLLLWPTASNTQGTSFEDFIDLSINANKHSKGTDTRNLTQEYPTESAPVLVIFGTEYGFAEEVSSAVQKEIWAKKLKCSSGLLVVPRVLNIKNFDRIDWTKESFVIFILSTAGNGVPPSESRNFMDYLQDKAMENGKMKRIRFCVLALGDTSYPHFCAAGRELEKRLEKACEKESVLTRTDVDQEDWSVIQKWIQTVIQHLDNIKDDLYHGNDYLSVGAAQSECWDRRKPFKAQLLYRIPLTTVSDKDDRDTVKLAFDVSGSGLKWQAGDALGIYPHNHPEDIQKFLQVLNLDGKTELSLEPTVNISVLIHHDRPTTLTEVLTYIYDLKRMKPDFWNKLFNKSMSQHHLLKKIQHLQQSQADYLSTHTVPQVIEEFCDVFLELSLYEVMEFLRPIVPRYYSISSSYLVDPNLAAVTVAKVQYNQADQVQHGLASTFMIDVLPIGQHCRVFVSTNHDFRLPSNPQTNIIMIGPGTGIAPFMTFIEERILVHSGMNYLYFGCRQNKKDFLYKCQLQRWCQSNQLKLRVAFSRDQDYKVYVQDLLWEDRTLIWELIAGGGFLYVCGDAKYMAKDVYSILRDIVVCKTGVDPVKAEVYLEELEREGRYQQDVWT